MRYLTLCVFVLISTLLYSQGSKKSAFWTSYQNYQERLYKDVSGTKAEIEKRILQTASNNDSAILINDLILFDLYDMYNDISKIKELGLKLKAQEILFDDETIKTLIFTRYLKALFYSRDDYAFEKELHAKIPKLKFKKDYANLASVYTLLARQKLNLNQVDSSAYYMNLAISNARKQTNKKKLIDIVIEQAKIFNKIKNEEDALSKAYLALQMSLESNYHYGVFNTSLLLAIINAKHANYDEMSNSLNAAKKAGEKISYKRGVQYVKLFEFQYKDKISEQDKQRFEQLKNNHEGDAELMGILSEIEGKIATQEKEYASALQHFNNAIVEFEKIDNTYNIQRIYQQLANVLVLQQKYDKALVYLDKSRSLLNALNEYSESTLLLKKIAFIYAKKGDKTTAYTILNQYVVLQDSLQLADIQSNLILLQQQSKADERERLITLQSDSIKTQQKEKDYTTTMLENVKLKNNLKTYIIIGFLGLVLSAGIILFFKWNQNLIQQRQREAEMNQTLLRTQMNPHFVFNAMSVIQSYIYDNDTKNSTKFLVNFSKLMRLILENSSKEFIPMPIEHEILDKYLSVQKLRFEDRFNFNIFTDEDLLNDEVMIPPMVTQPFIENAIEHGQLHLREDGFINISFHKSSDKLLEIKITDNGIGRKKAQEMKKSEAHKSMAIGITKERIESLNKKYKTEGKLTFEDYDTANEVGTIVTITIPFTKIGV